MPAPGLRVHLAALAGYSCVALWFAWPLPVHLRDSFPGDPGGDIGVYAWNLWVFRYELVTHHAFPFLTRSILTLEPSAVPLTLHNYTTAANVVGIPLIQSVGLVATYNLLTISSGVLAAYAMFLYARRRTGDAIAAFVAGLLFGFNPFMTARATAHFSLIQTAPLPVFGLLMLKMFERPTLRLAAGAGLVVAWAFLSDPYYAVYCLLIVLFMVGYSLTAVESRPAPIQRTWWRLLIDLVLLCLAGLIAGIALRGGGRFVVFGLRLSMTQLYTPMLIFTVLLGVRLWMLVRPRFAWRELFSPAHLRPVIFAAVVCAVALGPVLYAMREPAAGRPWRGPRVLWRSSAPGVDLASWITPNPFHPLWGSGENGWLSRLPNGFEENVTSIPWVAMLAIAVAARTAAFRGAAGWWVFTGLFTWLSLGPFVRVFAFNTYVPTPWALLRYLPIVGAARMPTRMTVLVMLGVSMLLALALAHLRQRSTRPRVAALLVGGLLTLELLPAPRPLFSAAIPAIYRVIAADPRPVRLLNLPFGLRDGLSTNGAFSAKNQYFQTLHEKPLIGGYLSRLPDGTMTRYRGNRVLRVLLRLSEDRPLDEGMKEAALASAPAFVERMQMGYALIDTGLCSRELVEFAKQAFSLTPVAAEGPLELYRTRLP
jgi:hypothetical protein